MTDPHPFRPSPLWYEALRCYRCGRAASDPAHLPR